MSAIRRLYIFLAVAASLLAVSASAIALLRNLLTPGIEPSLDAAASQIGWLLVGLPLYLVHWRWAQRGALGDLGERGAVMRQVFLYGVMGVSLGNLMATLFRLLSGLLTVALGGQAVNHTGGYAPSILSLVVSEGIALAVLALLWAYHRQVAVTDRQETPELAGQDPVERIYLYTFCAAGLIMTVLALVALSRWLLVLLSATAVVSRQGIARDVVRLGIGLAVWVSFWTRAQRLAAAEDGEGRVSAVRRVYLYATLLVSVLSTVGTLAIVLAGVFERLLAVRSASGGSSNDLREAASTVLVMGVVWAYHAYALRGDADAGGRTGWVRRLYYYLVAGVGLGAFLGGLAGTIGVGIRALSGATGAGLSGQAADYIALLVAGLPVWVVPWRQLQSEATSAGPGGEAESQSAIRRAYLYLFTFIATMTVLGSGVFVASRLVGHLLGVQREGNLIAEIAQALAYVLIAVGLWVYHGTLLRADSRRAHEAISRRLRSLKVVLLDPGDGRLAHAFAGELERELPGLRALTIGPSPAADVDVATALREADVIVAPWTVVLPGGEGTAGSTAGTEVARAMAASAASRILLPSPRERWHWMGAGGTAAASADPQASVREAVRTIEGIAGGDARLRPSLGPLAIAGIVLGVLVLLAILVPALGFLWQGI